MNYTRTTTCKDMNMLTLPLPNMLPRTNNSNTKKYDSTLLNIGKLLQNLLNITIDKKAFNNNNNTTRTKTTKINARTRTNTRTRTTKINARTNTSTIFYLKQYAQDYARFLIEKNNTIQRQTQNNFNFYFEINELVKNMVNNSNFRLNLTLTNTQNSNTKQYTWNNFKKIVSNTKQTQKNTNTNTETNSNQLTNCNIYSNFRVRFVAILIISILLLLFHNTGISPPYFILKYIVGNRSYDIYTSEDDNNKEINPYIITICPIGSTTVSSDHDVNITCCPPHTCLAYFNKLFNYAFTHESINTKASVLFDTNIYAFPLYLYLNHKDIGLITSSSSEYITITPPNTQVSTQNNNNPDKHVYVQLFLNPVFDTTLYNNDFICASLLYFNIHTNLQSWIPKNPSITSNDNIHKIFDNITKDNYETQLSELSTTLDILNNSHIALNTPTTKNTTQTPIELCLKGASIVNKDDCIPTSKSDITEIDNKMQEYIKKIIDYSNNYYYQYERNTNTTQHQTQQPQQPQHKYDKNKLLSNIRMTLWFADETYMSLSSYFHCIHLILAIDEQQRDTLLSQFIKQDLVDLPEGQIQPKEQLKSICKIAILENFAFMHHYIDKKTIEEFISSIAKYLARASHAYALYKYIEKNSIKMLKHDNEIIKLSRDNTFLNLGKYRFIIKRYKNNDITYNEYVDNDLYNKDQINDDNKKKYINGLYIDSLSQLLSSTNQQQLITEKDTRIFNILKIIYNEFINIFTDKEKTYLYLNYLNY